MTTFSESAQASAKRYYDYLAAKEKGKAEVGVSRISKWEEDEKVFFFLRMNKGLTYWESGKIKIKEVEYDQNQIQLIEYDEEMKLLKIFPSKPELILTLLEVTSDEVKVVSDLKFLVKRVQWWYAEHGQRLELPSERKALTMGEDSEKGNDLSQEQIKAIQTALSEPFSYIWGAPGTGKTKRVLAQCLMYYIRKKEPVVISAPTNNAIEQILRGVLPILKEADISLGCVVRMGMASRAFALEYPEVCENTRQASVLMRLNDRKIVLSELIKQCEEKVNNRRKRQTWQSAYEEISDFYNRAKDAYKEINQVLVEIHRLCNDELIAKTTIKDMEEDLSKIPTNKNRIADEVRNIERQVRRYDTKLGRWLFRDRLSELKTRNESKLREYETCEEKERELKEAIQNKRQQCDEIQARREELLEKKRRVSEDIASREKRFTKKVPPSIKEVSDRNASVEYLMRLDKWWHGLSETYERIMAETNSVQNVTEENLIREQEMLRNQLAEVEEEKARVSKAANQGNPDALVRAATIDTLIGRLNPSEASDRPKHIFLDEAGYCSLIKGAVLLGFQCPVTLLGDHMQLPPVCEMDDKQIGETGNGEVALWAQSVLYAEDVFSKDVLQIAESYLKNDRPPFKYLKCAKLTYTFRYSQVLADILSEHVYKIRLNGAIDHETEIWMIDAQRRKDDTKRGNGMERRAIIEYCRTHLDEDIAVLTPYTEQARALRRELTDAQFEDRIMTVHSSQGREWDTILFSVVDTTNKWFTDSLSQASRGKQVINTAVSRAKKKLVIVCEKQYWEKQTQQLIGCLVAAAKQ